MKLCLNILLLVAASLGNAATAAGPADELLTIPLPGGAPRIDGSFGAQPLAFEPNVGQTDAEVEFLARGKGYQLFLTATEAVMVLSSTDASDGAERLGVRQPAAALWDAFGFWENREFTALSDGFESGAGAPQSKTLSRSPGRVEYPPGLGLRQPSAAFPPFAEPFADALGSLEPSPSSPHSRVLRMRLVGANDSPPVSGDVELTDKVNYFIGNDPSRWRTNLPTFAKVQYRDVYPGTDLVYYGNQEGRLEYDFVLAPGANPNQIAMEFEGAERLELDAQGDLIAWVEGRAVRWRKPVVYQESDGQRVEIAGAYRLNDASLTYQAEAPRRIGFELAAYDSSKPLVIDPVLVYSTYLGGGGNDRPDYGTSRAIAADSQGNACVVGQTDSLNFPVKNALQSELAGGFDAFVTKLSRSGDLLFSTYLGGKGHDGASGVALDLQGNIHVAGWTVSTNFPLVNPLQATFGGPADGLLAILSPDGAAVTFSTYWGGVGSDLFYGVAIDPGGNIYLAGSSHGDFPVHNALQSQPAGLEDAVVVKLEAGGKGVIYSTYFGGSDWEKAHAIAADAEGFAYIVGPTTSYDLPVLNAYQPSITGDLSVVGTPYSDFFYARITPNGSGVVYSSYFGSYGSDDYPDLALGFHGELWLAGGAGANSEGLATPGAFQTSVPAWTHAGIVARFNATNGVLEAATYLNHGGSVSIAVDKAGHVWVGGTATAGLALVDPVLPGYANEFSEEGFVAKLSSDCSRLLFSTYFGGPGRDASQGFSLCLDHEGNVLLFGDTESRGNFPLVNAFQTNLNGAVDTFVAKISLAEVLKMTRSGPNVSLSWPASATNYILEATSSLPAVSWSTVTNNPIVTTAERSVQLPLTGNAKFFRLRQP